VHQNLEISQTTITKVCCRHGDSEGLLLAKKLLYSRKPLRPFLSSGKKELPLISVRKKRCFYLS